MYINSDRERERHKKTSLNAKTVKVKDQGTLYTSQNYM